MRRDPLALNHEEELFTLIAESVSSGAHEETLIDRVNVLLHGGFDWVYFLRLADYHNYLAAAYRFFRDSGNFDDLPDHVKVEFEKEYLLSQARFAKKESELIEILGAFEAQGLDAVVFKGIPQAYILYNDPGIRVSMDIDLLIDKSQIEKAQQVLFDLGFSIYPGLITEQEYREHHFHLIYSRGENKDIVVELHWTLVDPKKGHEMDCETVLQGAVPVKIRDRFVKTLTLAHSLWYMCMHLSYKAYLDVRGHAELKRLVEKMSESDWTYVIEWAKESDTLDQLNLAFAVCEILFGSFLDEKNSRLLKPSLFVNRFTVSMYYPRGLVWDWVPFLDTHEIIVLLSLRSGIRKKASFLFNLLFPDRKMLYEVYPGKLIQTEDSKRRLYFKGIYVFLKVIVLIFLMGLLIQSKVVGERMLDPVKGKNGLEE